MRIEKPGKRKGVTLLKTADDLCGKIVRARGQCDNCQTTADLQWAHGFSRSYRKVRHDLRNSFCLCKSCHMYYTNRPLEWDEWLRAWMGDALYYQLRHKALHGDTVDLKETCSTLRATANMLGIT